MRRDTTVHVLASPRRSCFHPCLFVVCLLVGLRRNYWTNFRKIRWKGGTRAMKDTIG